MKRSIHSSAPLAPAARTAGWVRWAVLALAVLAGVHRGEAATYYWGNSTSGNKTLTNASNWSDNAVSGGTFGTAPGSADTAVFNQSSNTGTFTGLTGVLNVNGIVFSNTGTTTLSSANGGTTRSGGITVNAGAGNATIDGGSWTFDGSQTFQNNSSSLLSFKMNAVASGSGTRVLTNAGTGTGKVELTGSYTNSFGNATVAGLVQNSATSNLRLLGSTGADNTAVLNVEIKQGTLEFANNTRALGANTGNLFLGNVSGGSASATLLTDDGGNRTWDKPIRLSSGVTGTLTIARAAATGTQTTNMNGGVTGSNSFTIENRSGDDHIAFGNATLNNVGTITHIGAGTGNATISSVIGTNVTGVIQNSSTSRLILNGNNTYSGNTTITAGTLALGSAGSIDSSLNINVASGATFDVTGKSGFAIVSGQTLAGRGTINGLATFNSGSNLGFDAAGPLTALNTLAFTSFGISSLSGVNWDALTLDTPYSIIAGVQDFASAGLANFGVNNKTPVGTGNREAYFTSSGNTLQFVVVPEPSGIVLAGLSVAAGACLIRRRWLGTGSR